MVASQSHRYVVVDEPLDVGVLDPHGRVGDVHGVWEEPCDAEEELSRFPPAALAPEGAGDAVQAGGGRMD